MNIRKVLLIATLFLVKETEIIAKGYAHSVILDAGNDMEYRFLANEGICSAPSNPHGRADCLENELWFGYPQTEANFHFGYFNRLRFEEIDRRTRQITYCQATGNNVMGNTNIRLQKGCKVRVWDAQTNRIEDWPSQISATKPTNWKYPNK